jgi:hypothetical protein
MNVSIDIFPVFLGSSLVIIILIYASVKSSFKSAAIFFKSYTFKNPFESVSISLKTLCISYLVSF